MHHFQDTSWARGLVPATDLSVLSDGAFGRAMRALRLARQWEVSVSYAPSLIKEVRMVCRLAVCLYQGHDVETLAYMVASSPGGLDALARQLTAEQLDRVRAYQGYLRDKLARFGVAAERIAAAEWAASL